MLEAVGNVIARGDAGVAIASQSRHRLPPLSVEQNKAALATTPVEELLLKTWNSLRVMAEAVRWGTRGAWINTISPSITIHAARER